MMSDVRPLATVIICTRNRALSLDRALRSIVESSLGVTERWELLVVDNGSTDGTPEVVQGYRDILPIRLVSQPLAGLSHARNAGVAASSGDFVLWTDDDVVVDLGWLGVWMAAFKTHSEHAIFGGRSEPILEEPHQPWFRANYKVLESLLAIRDDPSWTAVTGERIPYGLNFAIRGKEQRAHQYDPELGVAPGRRRGGEETDLMWKLLAQGCSGQWVWGATVYHVIPTARQTPAYIMEFYRANGYDHPIDGVVYGVTNRLCSIIKTICEIAKYSAVLALSRMKGNGFDPANLVRLARAEGSLVRYARRG